MSLEALIFDVDGTLADTEEIHRRAFNTAFEIHGLPWSWGARDYAGLLGTTGGKERLRRFIDSLDLTEPRRAALHDLVASLHETKTRIYAGLLARGCAQLRPEVERVIRQARAAGLDLAIASTTTLSNAEALLVATLGPEARGWFRVIASGDIVPRKKPAPDIYELVLHRLGLRAEQCVAFEDSEIGVRAAQAAGLFVVALPTGWTVDGDFSIADAIYEPRAPGPDLDEIRALHAASKEEHAAAL